MFPRTGFTLEHCRILSTFRLTFRNFYINLFKPLIYHIRSYVGMSFFGQLFQKDAPVLSRMIVSRLVSRSKIVESFQTFNPSFKFQRQRLQEDAPVHEWSFRNQKLSNPSKHLIHHSNFRANDSKKMYLFTNDRFVTKNCRILPNFPSNDLNRMLHEWFKTSFTFKNCRIFSNF